MWGHPSVSVALGRTTHTLIEFSDYYRSVGNCWHFMPRYDASLAWRWRDKTQLVLTPVHYIIPMTTILPSVSPHDVTNCSVLFRLGIHVVQVILQLIFQSGDDSHHVLHARVMTQIQRHTHDGRQLWWNESAARHVEGPSVVIAKVFRGPRGLRMVTQLVVDGRNEQDHADGKTEPCKYNNDRKLQAYRAKLANLSYSRKAASKHV